MPERATSRGTASDRLQRILYLLPVAGAEEGAPIEGLCDDLGVSRKVLLDDIAEVTAREYYHRAGSGDRLRISLDPERVRVRTTGQFRRPPKLTAREKMALGLGLRVLAAERDPDGREALLDLAARLERGLATVSEIEFAPPVAIEDASLSAPDSDDDTEASPGGKRDGGEEG
ncbi:MAG: hypothetical protein R3266_06930, partial [Gemmatimonadota bacterium]|nr:hypothetical protein [Gemmatimonadota bacterium]